MAERTDGARLRGGPLASRSLLRRALWAAIAAVSVVVVTLAAGVVVYMFPRFEPLPDSVDVVYVIGPATTERITLARDLIDAGKADVMLISVPQSVLDEGQRRFRKCNLPDGDVICFSPKPRTTKGEAVGLEAMAEENGWTSAIVITQTAHVARTRVLMERCFSGDLSMRAADTDMTVGDWLYQFAYQTAAFGKVFTDQSCTPSSDDE